MGHFRPSSTIITRKVDGPSNYFILYFRVANIRTLWCYVMQPSWKATIRSDEFRSNCFSLHYIFPVLFTCFPRVIVICEDTVRLKHNSREMLIFAIQTLTLQVTIRELVSHWCILFPALPCICWDLAPKCLCVFILWLLRGKNFLSLNFNKISSHNHTAGITKIVWILDMQTRYELSLLLLLWLLFGHSSWILCKSMSHLHESFPESCNACWCTLITTFYPFRSKGGRVPYISEVVRIGTVIFHPGWVTKLWKVKLPGATKNVKMNTNWDMSLLYLQLISLWPLVHTRLKCWLKFIAGSL